MMRFTGTTSKSQILVEIRACLLLAVPLAAAQLSQAATMFIDTVMMGMLGGQFLAAGGLGAVVFSALLLVGTGVVSAVGPFAAEAHGSGKKSWAGRVGAQGLWLSLGIALPMMLLIWQMGPILRVFGQEEGNVILAQGYLRAIVWGFFPGLAFATLKNFMSALSRPRPVMVIMVLGTLLNISLNYVLMFGKLGLPRLELVGIGWASTLSYWLTLGILTLYILNQKFFDEYDLFYHLSRFNWPVFRDLVQTGWPIGVLFAVETGLFTVTTFLMGSLGTVTLAAHQIALQTASITFMVPVGISQAVTVRVGQLMGREETEAARLAGYVGMSISALFMSMMAVLMWTMPEAIASLYLDIRDPANWEVVQVAVALLSVAALFQLFDGIQIVAAGALRGLKDTRIPMFIGVFAYWCVGLASGYTLGIGLGLGGVGLWVGLAIGLAVSSATLSWRFHSLIAPMVRGGQRAQR